jgi:hypothetical protein
VHCILKYIVLQLVFLWWSILFSQPRIWTIKTIKRWEGNMVQVIGHSSKCKVLSLNLSTTRERKRERERLLTQFLQVCKVIQLISSKSETKQRVPGFQTIAYLGMRPRKDVPQASLPIKKPNSIDLRNSHTVFIFYSSSEALEKVFHYLESWCNVIL